MTETALGVADPSARLVVEQAGESGGTCACCGRASHTLWGYVHEAEGPTLAAYFLHWTDGHFDQSGANLNLVVGAWGDGASPADRATVSLVQRRAEDGSAALTVIDADPEPAVADHALTRDEVAARSDHIFRIIDAIYEQDRRAP